MKDKGLLTYKGNFSRWVRNYKVLEPLAIKEITTKGVLDTIWKENNPKNE